MENTISIDGMPEHFFANLFAIMYVGMAPLTAMFNNSIKKIAKFFYSEQLYLLINELNAIEIRMETIAILGVNVCVILSCFIIAYQKVFIKQY